MSSKTYERYADPVRIQYLAYEENKKNKKSTNYLKHVPKNLQPLPEFSDNMSMLFHDKTNNELIYAMRGLDFDLIKQDMPFLASGIAGSRFIGGKLGEMTGGKRNIKTGQLLGASIGTYLFGNPEVKTALDIMLSGAFDEKAELDPETNQIKKTASVRFVNEYRDDLNRELFKLRDIQSTFPNTKLVLAGHSRAGAKAKDLATMLDLEAHIFNPAESTVYGNLLLQAAMPSLVSSVMGDSSLIRTAETTRNIPINIQGLTEAASKYAQLYAGGNLMKYTLNDKEELEQTNLLGNPFAVAGVSSLMENLINPKERVELENKNISIHRTPDDLVSKGFSDIYNIEPKEEVPVQTIERIIGKHNIDHFTSDELYKSILNDEPIQDKPPEPKKEFESRWPVRPYEEKDNIFANIGTPRFKELDPYLLCLENPSLVGCSEFYNM